MINMKCPIKCPICGEMLQKYGEVDPDAGTSIVLGANCPKCNIGNSDIKLWQELIRTRKALEIARNALKDIDKLRDLQVANGGDWMGCAIDMDIIARNALEQITHDNSEKVNSVEHKE